MDAQEWKSGRLTKKLPVLSVSPALHDAVHDYATKHSMKLSEVMRQALLFYLSSGSTKSNRSKTKSSEKRKGSISK